MRSDDNETCVSIGEVIDWIFNDGISVDALRDNPNNNASESKDCVMSQQVDAPPDRYGHKTEPTSIIHNLTSDGEFFRLLKAYREGHYGLLTTVQIRELEEIVADAERSKLERNN